MKVKLDNQNIFTLCTFLIAVTISCNSQSQTNNENKIVRYRQIPVSGSL